MISKADIFQIRAQCLRECAAQLRNNGDYRSSWNYVADVITRWAIAEDNKELNERRTKTCAAPPVIQN